ncbi:glycosyltransferase family 2 protein [Pedobacter aquatilis]|uniref:glycosyltransferase family 2 protein n=1 Tax=Pedobacter aquatilis TaxID=351343 RepID=UPI00292D8D06|nr:glycosyltransferase family 2 protein [Pedobacter aquatilis]
MKISLITVVYNGKAHIEDCIKSIISQSYKAVEYIVIDGGSTDGTLELIEQYLPYITHLISEKDKGLYDAINKGITLASGDVVGLLNADDMLADEKVITKIAAAFQNDAGIEGVHGDLNYITPDSGKVIRKWKGKQASFKEIEQGWMPAHPTLYLRRSLFDNYGNYALDLGTAADYDLMLRYFHTYKIKTKYLPFLMVNMRTGGVSNNSLKSLYKAFVNDYKALRKNAIPAPLMVVLKKKFSKIIQFW